MYLRSGFPGEPAAEAAAERSGPRLAGRKPDAAVGQAGPIAAISIQE